MTVHRPRTGKSGEGGGGLSAAMGYSPPSSLLDSPLAVVEVTAIAGVALHLQLALAIQGMTGDLQAERPFQVRPVPHVPAPSHPTVGRAAPWSVEQSSLLSPHFLTFPSLPPFQVLRGWRCGRTLPSGRVREPGSVMPGCPGEHN